MLASGLGRRRRTLLTSSVIRRPPLSVLSERRQKRAWSPTVTVRAVPGATQRRLYELL